MAKRKLPNHIPGTVEQWRRLKRKEWRKVRRAMDAFWLGSVYTPAAPYGHIAQFRRVADEISQLLKGNWNP